ncbi:threonine-rich protein-like [Macrobrachium rosenbergii]|uniref:threonine-rich protein-like n=1 Tax=Macrobrachium rosenbergii TaxID=79674 RepID=UPI0034D79A6C
MGVLELLTGALLLVYFTTTVTPWLHGESFKAYPTRGRIPEATPTPECIDTITCGSAKFVAKCVTCRPEYFYCPTPGGPPIVEECSSGLVFNPDPNYPKCILKSNCPYHPPWTLPTTAPPPTTTTTPTTPPATTTTAAVTTAAPTTAAGSTTAGGNATTPGTGPTSAPPTTTAGPSTTTAAPATTTTAPATTTAAPTPTPECVDSLTCPASGFFAQCVTCQPTFFQCTAAGTAGVLRQCSSGLVFNTDPAYPKCVLASNCPYHPQF